MQFFNWWRFIRPYLPCTIIIIILWSSWLIWFFDYFWYLFSPIECRLSLHSQFQMICVRVSGRIEIWKYPAAIYSPPPKIAMRKILYLIQRRWWWWCCIFLELPKYMNFIRKMFQIVMLFLFFISGWFVDTVVHVFLSLSHYVFRPHFHQLVRCARKINRQSLKCHLLFSKY